MRTFLCSLCLGLGVATASLAQELPNLEDILADLDAHAAEAESMTFDFVATTAAGSEMAGSVAAKGEKSRANLTMNSSGSESALQLTSNGTEQWIEMDMGEGNKMVMKIDPSVYDGIPEDVRAVSMIDAQQGASQFIQDPRDSWRRMQEVFGLAVTGEGERNGDAVWILEGDAKAGDTVSTTTVDIESVRFEIGKDDGYPRYGEFIQPDGAKFMTVELKNLALGAEIDDAQFEYTAPEGVPTMDMTQMIKQQLDMLQNPPE